MSRKNRLSEETLTLPELSNIEERTRLCWASLFAKNLYDQEVTVVNPAPKTFDGARIFPDDIYIATYHSTDPTLPTYEELLQYAKRGYDILCEGTHDQSRETTYVLWSLPDPIPGTNITTIISHPEVETESERDLVVKLLIDAYREKSV